MDMTISIPDDVVARLEKRAAVNGPSVGYRTLENILFVEFRMKWAQRPYRQTRTPPIARHSRL
jgi:hypothetical protein